MDNNSDNLQDATIMMVDDEPITMFVVQTYLEEFGYQKFVQVEESTEAVKVLEETLPDVLLLDLMMPGISGFDILQVVRSIEKFKYLPIIVLTSSSDAENKLKALELGATDFLAKPVDQSELGLRVRNTLAAKAYMDQLAFYDPITRLPNKFMFDDRFNWSLNKAKRYTDRLALLNITIDNFSRINATIGVAAADAVLKEVANRLTKVVRDADSLTYTLSETAATLSLFRLEGSVFSILLDRTRTAESAAIVAGRILEEIRKPFEHDDDELYLTASIGISTYPDEGTDTKSLRQLATSARDFTVNQGGDGFHFSSEAINSLYRDRMDQERKLRKALERNEFVLYYQPKVSVETNEILGVEALLRWEPEPGKLISPIKFIPLLEETGLIVSVGEWILQEAFGRQEAWSKLFGKSITMAINLSVKQLDDRGFLDIIKRLVETTDISPGLIDLEITESLLLGDIEKKIELLHEFRKLGLKVSIDDFGTGYSSLAYLAKLPLDELKIDKSFIDDVVENKDSQAIVSSIVFLARSLGMSTIAEGVEQPEQLEFLKKVRCEMYQGYYFSRPIPETELLELLATSRR